MTDRTTKKQKKNDVTAGIDLIPMETEVDWCHGFNECVERHGGFVLDDDDRFRNNETIDTVSHTSKHHETNCDCNECVMIKGLGYTRQWKWGSYTVVPNNTYIRNSDDAFCLPAQDRRRNQLLYKLRDQLDDCLNYSDPNCNCPFCSLNRLKATDCSNTADKLALSAAQDRMENADIFDAIIRVFGDPPKEVLKLTPIVHELPLSTSPDALRHYFQATLNIHSLDNPLIVGVSPPLGKQGIRSVCILPSNDKQNLFQPLTTALDFISGFHALQCKKAISEIYDFSSCYAEIVYNSEMKDPKADEIRAGLYEDLIKLSRNLCECAGG